MIALVAKTGPRARRSAGVASRQRRASRTRIAVTSPIAATLMTQSVMRPVCGLSVSAIVLSGHSLPQTRSVSSTSRSRSAGTVTTA